MRPVVSSKPYLLAAVLILIGPDLSAARCHPESYYRNWAAAELGGETEVVLPNGTRCDILTEHYAVEVDFADKWAEALGQCLNYAAQTHRQPGIVLILESPDDKRHLARLQETVEHYRLPVRIMPLYGFIPSAFEPKKMKPSEGP